MKKIILLLGVMALLLLSGCPQSYCGDGTCDADETYVSCSADCEVPSSYCGDGTCDADETYVSCSADCEQPQPDVSQLKSLADDFILKTGLPISSGSMSVEKRVDSSNISAVIREIVNETVLIVKEDTISEGTSNISLERMVDLNFVELGGDKGNENDKQVVWDYFESEIQNLITAGDVVASVEWETDDGLSTAQSLSLIAVDGTPKYDSFMYLIPTEIVIRDTDGISLQGQNVVNIDLEEINTNGFGQQRVNFFTATAELDVKQSELPHADGTSPFSLFLTFNSGVRSGPGLIGVYAVAGLGKPRFNHGNLLEDNPHTSILKIEDCGVFTGTQTAIVSDNQNIGETEYGLELGAEISGVGGKATVKHTPDSTKTPPFDIISESPKSIKIIDTINHAGRWTYPGAFYGSSKFSMAGAIKHDEAGSEGKLIFDSQVQFAMYGWNYTGKDFDVWATRDILIEDSYTCPHQRYAMSVTTDGTDDFMDCYTGGMAETDAIAMADLTSASIQQDGENLNLTLVLSESLGEAPALEDGDYLVYNIYLTTGEAGAWEAPIDLVDASDYGISVNYLQEYDMELGSYGDFSWSQSMWKNVDGELVTIDGIGGFGISGNTINLTIPLSAMENYTGVLNWAGVSENAGACDVAPDAAWQEMSII